MALQDLRAAFFLVAHDLRHESLFFALSRKPLRAFRYRIAFRFRLQRRRFPLEDMEENLFRAIGAMDFIDRFQQFEGEIITVAREQIVGSPRQAVDHFRPAHFLRASPGIEVAIALQGETMLFDAHVTHLHLPDELVNRKSLRALERVKNFQPLGAADFRQ